MVEQLVQVEELRQYIEDYYLPHTCVVYVPRASLMTIEDAASDGRGGVSVDSPPSPPFAGYDETARVACRLQRGTNSQTAAIFSGEINEIMSAVVVLPADTVVTLEAVLEVNGERFEVVSVGSRTDGLTLPVAVKDVTP